MSNDEAEQGRHPKPKKVPPLNEEAEVVRVENYVKDANHDRKYDIQKGQASPAGPQRNISAWQDRMRRVHIVQYQAQHATLDTVKQWCEESTKREQV
ncbi:hypothetical protein HC256_003745 [Beauveria bassiana]|nr:hypothetical protein HC256_003745 [Beauveria bassiana]